MILATMMFTMLPGLINSNCPEIGGDNGNDHEDCTHGGNDEGHAGDGGVATSTASDMTMMWMVMIMVMLMTMMMVPMTGATLIWTSMYTAWMRMLHMLVLTMRVVMMGVGMVAVAMVR